MCQPIDTAPRDGTEIVAGTPISRTIRWIAHPVTSRYLDGRWCAHFGDGKWLPYAPQPTHWLP